MINYRYGHYIKHKLFFHITHFANFIADYIFYIICNGFNNSMEERELIKIINRIQKYLNTSRYKYYTRKYLKKWLYDVPLDGIIIEFWVSPYCNENKKPITEKQLKKIIYKIADLILTTNRQISKQDIENLLKDYIIVKEKHV